MMYNQTNNYIVTLCAIIIIHFANPANSVVKTWTRTNNIFDKRNWWHGNHAPNCHGLYFAAHNDAPIIVDDIYTSQLVLPLNGEIILKDHGKIVFNSNPDCIKLNPFHYHRWDDPLNWMVGNGRQNLAVPHLERIPCIYDDVVIPMQSQPSIDLPSFDTISLNSLTINNRNMSNAELQNYLERSQDKIFLQQYQKPFQKLRVEKKRCTDPSGCLCHNRQPDYCASIEEFDLSGIRCLDPVQPIGFCRQICGGYVLIKDQKLDKSMMETIFNKIAASVQQNIDWHLSKVMDSMGPVIQIVFAEEQYSEQSSEITQQLFIELSHDPNLSRIEMYQSGSYYAGEDGTTANGSSLAFMVFGTLFGVVAVFALLFFIYDRDESIYLITNRFRNRLWHYERGRLMTSGGAAGHVLFTARYDNNDNTDEEGRLIISDQQSLAGSVLSLDKSFDNPMYGRRTPSTSTDALSIEEMKTETTETMIMLAANENPLYGIELLEPKTDD